MRYLLKVVAAGREESSSTHSSRRANVEVGSECEETRHCRAERPYATRVRQPPHRETFPGNMTADTAGWRWLVAPQLMTWSVETDGAENKSWPSARGRLEVCAVAAREVQGRKRMWEERGGEVVSGRARRLGVSSCRRRDRSKKVRRIRSPCRTSGAEELERARLSGSPSRGGG